MRPYIYSIALAFASFSIQSKECDAFEYLSSLTKDSVVVDSLIWTTDIVEYGTDTAVSRCLSQYSDPAIDSFFESEENYIRLVIFPTHLSSTITMKYPILEDSSVNDNVPDYYCPRILWIGMPRNDTSRVLGIINNTLIDTCIIGLTGKYEKLTSVLKYENNKLFNIIGNTFNFTEITHYVNRTRAGSVYYSGVRDRALFRKNIDWCNHILSSTRAREAICAYAALIQDLRVIFLMRND